MKNLKLFSMACLALLTSGTSLAVCERNVDNVEIHYINGMFTDYAGYLDNLHAISEFTDSYLSNLNLNYGVSGTHNISEQGLSQALQVARHKQQDADATVRLAILQFLNGDPEYLNNPETVETVREFLNSINEAYAGILAEQDALQARTSLVALLDSCARVILFTHSQGNFYGNALFNELYGSYAFPNGYSLAQYPMLGNVQIASPVYVPGGAASTLYPDAVDHITNSTDLIMTLVRASIGAVGENYDSKFNTADLSGHALELSYLRQPGQATAIAGVLTRIIYGFTPYPLHGQYAAAASTALRGYGYSSISKLLDIQFTDGSVYRYSDVLEGVHYGLQSASSQGAYFNQYIRGIYSYERME